MQFQHHLLIFYNSWKVQLTAFIRFPSFENISISSSPSSDKISTSYNALEMAVNFVSLDVRVIASFSDADRGFAGSTMYVVRRLRSAE